MTNSWPLLCGHLLHGWVWRCCSIECPNWGEKWHSVDVARSHNFSGEPLHLPVRFYLSSSYLHHELLVICNRSKEWLVKQVPRNVFYHSSVTGEDSLRIHYLPLLWHSTYVPQTDGLDKIRKDGKSILIFILLHEIQHEFIERSIFKLVTQ